MMTIRNHYQDRPCISLGLLHLACLCLISAILLFGLGQSSPFSTVTKGHGQLTISEDSPWQPHDPHHNYQGGERLTYGGTSDVHGPYIEAGSSPHHQHQPIVNISAQDGSHAYLPCTVKRLGSKSVSWIRKSDGYLLTVDRDVFIGDNRFNALHLIASDTWTLHIRNVMPNDAGIYECQVSSEPKMSLMFHLHVITPQVEIKGSPEIYVNSGSHQVELQCLLTDVLEEPPFIFWYYDDRRLLIDDAGDIGQPQAQVQVWTSADDDALKTVSSDENSVEYSRRDNSHKSSYEEEDRYLHYNPNHENINNDNGGNDASAEAGVSWSTDEEAAKEKASSRPHQGRRSGRRFKAPSIKSTDIIRLEPGTILSRLTIFQPSMDDSGHYQCRPSNLASANVTLHVLDGEHEEPAAAVQSDGSNSSSSVLHWRFCISAALITMTTSILL